MRPAPIPAEAVWPGARRLVIAPPDGDMTDPDVAPVEAVVDRSESLGGVRVSVRCVLEPGDLEKLAAGGAVWLSFYGSPILPFSVDVVEPDTRG